MGVVVGFQRALSRSGKRRVVRSRLAGILLVAMGITSEVAAQPENPLALALEAWNRGAIDVAHRHFESALASSNNDAASLVTIYRHLALSRDLLGDSTGAHRAIAYALALDPSASPVAESGPEQRAAFDRVRAIRSDTRLSVHPEVVNDESEPGPLRIAIITEGAPPGLASAIELRATAGDSEIGWQHRMEGSGGEIELPSEWANRDEITLELRLQDAAGSTILRVEQTIRIRTAHRDAGPAEDPVSEALALAPPREEELADPAILTPIPFSPPEVDRPGWKSPWLWAAVGLVIAGGVTTAVVLSGQRVQGVTFGAPTLGDE